MPRVDQVQDPLDHSVARVGQRVRVSQAGAAVIGVIGQDLAHRRGELVVARHDVETLGVQDGTREWPSRRSGGPSPSRP